MCIILESGGMMATDKQVDFAMKLQKEALSDEESYDKFILKNMSSSEISNVISELKGMQAFKPDVYEAINEMLYGE